MFRLFVILCFACASAPSFAQEVKQSYGIYEKITIKELANISMKAKLDTGALTSSLGADNITTFEKDGEDWVRFTPQVKGAVEVEFPVVRQSRIKMREGEESAINKRPVVMLDVCFNGSYYPLEVNLTNRENFNYPFLVGRKALIEMNVVVDPAEKYTFEPNCK